MDKRVHVKDYTWSFYYLLFTIDNKTAESLSTHMSMQMNWTATYFTTFLKCTCTAWYISLGQSGCFWASHKLLVFFICWNEHSCEYHFHNSRFHLQTISLLLVNRTLVKEIKQINFLWRYNDAFLYSNV